jgi:molecular chaperone DnaK (HSP70)
MSNQLFRLVVAIDFGTARSGYSIGFLGDSNIYTKKDWPGQHYKYPKTPTHLLYDSDGKLVAWGAQVVNSLAQQREQGKGNQFYLFENFKTLLHESKQSTERGPYIDREGRRFFVVDLIADYLEKLKNLAFTELEKITKETVENAEIRWCLTVPAIWSDAAKQLMEKAAIKAGLISSQGGDLQRLLFALEPEAAAVYCIEEDKALAQESKSGTRFMTVDCGGGTVDITVHEITPNGLKEVVRGSGGLYGGKNVDAAFRIHLGKAIGNDVVEQFEKRYPVAYQKMMDEWETFKCSYDPQLVGDIWNFELPARLRDLLMKEYPKRLEGLSQKQSGDDFHIWISRAVMETEIFGPTIQNIARCVEDQFTQLRSTSIDYLYLVGGFAGSVLLQKSIQSRFASKVKKKIIIPKEPGGAIVTGAASFGRNPALIRARRTRLTYGTDIVTSFIPGFHEENKKVHHPEHTEPLCKDIFQTFIHAGQSVEINSEVTEKFGVISASQREVHIGIFSTDEEEVIYIDEASVTKIGEIILKMPFTTGGLDRKLAITMYFGDTKIRAKAKDLTQGSGEEVEIDLDFSTTYSSERLGK